MACSEAGSTTRTGAVVLAEALLRLTQQPTVFLVTGNQNLPLVDALGRRGVRLVHARHESGAGYMAEGWARSSGQPGIALVTAGPGLTSALTPLASAAAAEVPLILLSASHPLSQDGTGAFQELPQTQLTGPLCKVAVRCPAAGQLALLLEWAWQEATTFPPGPVHLELPADVLTQPVQRELRRPAGPDLAQPAPANPVPTRCSAASTDRQQAERLARVLAGASQPLVLLRPSLARSPAAARLRQCLPTLAVESPRGLRDPAWADAQDLLGAADHIAVLGPPDFAVNFGQIGSANVLVHPGAGPAVLDELATLLAGTPRPAPPSGQAPASADIHAPGPMHPLAAAVIAGGLIRDDDVLVTDGGEFCQWIRHGLRHLPNTQLINGKLGAIGGSIPMAVGAAAHAPQRRHVVFTGDGSFGYYAAEIETAVRAGTPITIVIGVDGCWGSEWHQQTRHYGKHTYATELGDARYDLVAQGYGAQARPAPNGRQFTTALTWALNTDHVTCITARIQRAASPAT